MREKNNKGQRNLAKAASNAPHTVYALDSITIAVPKICSGSQKLEVGHVPDVDERMMYCCIVFVKAPSHL